MVSLLKWGLASSLPPLPHTLLRLYVLFCIIADSFDSSGLLEKFEISHKSSQENAYITRLKKRGTRQHGQRTGVIAVVIVSPKLCLESFYLCYGKCQQPLHGALMMNLWNSRARCCLYEPTSGERMCAFYNSIKSNYDPHNAEKLLSLCFQKFLQLKTHRHLMGNSLIVACFMTAALIIAGHRSQTFPWRSIPLSKEMAVDGRLFLPWPWIFSSPFPNLPHDRTGTLALKWVSLVSSFLT